MFIFCFKMNYQEMNLHFIKSKQISKLLEQTHISIGENFNMKKIISNKRNELYQLFYKFVDEQHVAKNIYIIEIQKLDQLLFQIETILNHLFNLKNALNDVK